MSDEEQPLAGPDLTHGVPADAVPEGAMLRGHAGEDAVLIARRGGELFAVGATCTHYNGPLAEGILVGDTVRCPWHHACFSLRTGEALRAPALNPVPCWTVEERDGRVFVGEKRDRAPLAPVPARRAAPRPGGPESVVIIGAGAAGAAAAEMLRREGYERSITMVDPDPDAPYDRPNLSKDYLAGSAPEDWIPLRPPGFYAEHGIEIVQASARAVSPATHEVVLDDSEAGRGRRLHFDRLLVATGAEPVRLTIPGSDAAHVRYLRTLADSRAIIARAAAVERAVVIGASFIGLEVAASLRARGLRVDIVAPEAHPLERVFGRAVGDAIQRVHEAHGVTFHLGETAVAIGEHTVTLSGGAEFEAGLVVVGVGVRPSLALLAGAGMPLDRGSVSVSGLLETSVPGIFAAGDIARWPDPHSGERIRVEHWAVAERQGQVAARNMLGAREEFRAVPFFWSQHYDRQLSYVGHTVGAPTVRASGDLGGWDAAIGYVEPFEGGERTVAVATLGRDRSSLWAEVGLELNDWAAVGRVVGGSGKPGESGGSA